MVNRIYNNAVVRKEDLKKPNLHFKLRCEIPFTCSITPSLLDDFDFKATEYNTDTSKMMRSLILKKLKLKNEQEFSKIKGVLEANELFRKALYDALKVTKLKNFSRTIELDIINPYLKNEKKMSS